MALSDREQRLLDELERGLYESDPNLAAKINSGGTRTTARIISGLAIGLIGLSLIVFAVIIQVAFFGAFAFLVMLTGLVVASSNTKQQASPAGKANGKAKAPSRNVFEERWQRRQGESGSGQLEGRELAQAKLHHHKIHAPNAGKRGCHTEDGSPGCESLLYIVLL